MRLKDIRAKYSPKLDFQTWLILNMAKLDLLSLDTDTCRWLNRKPHWMDLGLILNYEQWHSFTGRYENQTRDLVFDEMQATPKDS